MSAHGMAEGIVVAAFNSGESNRVIRVLTSNQGLVPLYIRGARQSKRRFPGVCEIGSTVRLSYRKPQSGLAFVRDAELLRGPSRSRQDLNRLAYLAYGCEVCGGLAPEGAPSPSLYGLLETWCELLETGDQIFTTHRLALEGKALAFAGFRPSFLKCVSCGQGMKEEGTFCAREGGMQHRQCGTGPVVSHASYTGFHAAMMTPMLEITGEKPDDLSTSWLLKEFIEYHLGRALRTADFLQEVVGS